MSLLNRVYRAQCCIDSKSIPENNYRKVLARQKKAQLLPMIARSNGFLYPSAQRARNRADVEFRKHLQEYRQCRYQWLCITRSGEDVPMECIGLPPIQLTNQDVE